jgi:integrase/recombinase XerD
MKNFEAWNCVPLKLEYLEDLRKRNLSVSTIHGRDKDLKPFFLFLSLECSITDVREVTREHAKKYIEYIQALKRKRDKKPIGRKYQYDLYRVAYHFFRFLERTDRILSNPMSGIEFEPPKRALPKDILTEDEARMLLDAPDIKTAEGVKHRAILEILYGSGLRKSELRGLRLSDLDLDNGYLFVSGKGAKDRLVPITKLAARFIKDYISRERSKFFKRKPLEDHIFLSYDGKLLSIDGIGKMIRRYVKEAGIKKNVTTHVLRHTCATHLLARGAALRYVQELLGHSDISTTEIYTRVAPVKLRNVYENTHPRCIGIKRGRPHGGKPRSGKPCEGEPRK